MSERRTIRRRDFLTKASLVGTAGIAGAAGVLDASAAPPNTRGKQKPKRLKKRPQLKDMAEGHFAPRVGEEFSVATSKRYSETAATEPLILKVRSTTGHPLADGDPRNDRRVRWVNGGNRMRYDPFSVLFSAPEGTSLQQGTYRLEHATLGKFDLFLVPVRIEKAPADLEFYEAVFN